MVSTLVLDVDSLTVIRELLDDIPLPAGFDPGWNSGADPVAVQAARAGAGQRLRTAGLVIPATSGEATGPSGRAAPGTVHPSLRTALEAFGRPGIHIAVRSWAGDRAVVSGLVVGAEAGIGLARLQRVPANTTPGPGAPVREADDFDRTVADALGVELAVFEPADTVAALRRLLPVLLDPPGADDAEPVRLAWTDALALLELLGRQDSVRSDQLPVAREVLRILLASAELSSVPTLLARLAGSLEAAIQITISVAGGEGPAPIWFGYWVQCDGRLVALRAAGGSDSPGDVVLHCVPADGESLQQDLLSAVTDAFVTAGLG